MYMNQDYDIKHLVVSDLLLNIKNYLQFFIGISGTKSVNKYKYRIISPLIMSQQIAVREIVGDILSSILERGKSFLFAM
jgi:hypothetical protein